MIKNKFDFTYWVEFVLALTEREIKARYKRAALGFLWIIIQPIMQMLIIGIVFQFFVPFKTDNYFLFLFSGLLPWNFFSLSISKVVPIFVNERYLLKKANFPRESLPLSMILANFFHFSVGAVLFIFLLGIMRGFSWTNLLFIPVSLWLLFLTFFLGLLLSSWNVKFRDINFIVQAILPIWFYATPIVYDLSVIPDWFQIILHLNPLTFIIEVFRFSFLSMPIDDFGIKLAINVIFTFLIFYLAMIVFIKENNNFDDWI